MKKLILPILALAAILGCATDSGEGVYVPQSAPQYDVENRERFVLMDAAVQRSIAASTLRENTLPDGRLDIAANVRNREGRPIQVQVNCEFKDAQGIALDSTPWQTLLLTENGQETIRFASMNNRARRYTIRIRQAR